MLGEGTYGGYRRRQGLSASGVIDHSYGRIVGMGQRCDTYTLGKYGITETRLKMLL